MSAVLAATGGSPQLAMRLPDLKHGHCGVIVGIEGGDALQQQLEASGLWRGVTIERLASAPFGDPLLFRVHGYRLALRRAEASRVLVLVCVA